MGHLTTHIPHLNEPATRVTILTKLAPTSMVLVKKRGDKFTP